MGLKSLSFVFLLSVFYSLVHLVLTGKKMILLFENVIVNFSKHPFVNISYLAVFQNHIYIFSYSHPEVIHLPMFDVQYVFAFFLLPRDYLGIFKILYRHMELLIDYSISGKRNIQNTGGNTVSK